MSLANKSARELREDVVLLKHQVKTLGESLDEQVQKRQKAEALARQLHERNLGLKSELQTLFDDYVVTCTMHLQGETLTEQMKHLTKFKMKPTFALTGGNKIETVQ